LTSLIKLIEYLNIGVFLRRLKQIGASLLLIHWVFTV